MKSLVLTIAMLASVSACAQHTHHHASSNGETTSLLKQENSPYSGMQNRRIKALSVQQIEEIRAGKGMALALPAELNGYPGPMHALELAERLELSAEQQAKTKQLLASMKSEARQLGEQLLEAETALDQLFQERKASPESIEAATAKAAQIQGHLRAAHLRYHFDMAQVLKPTQIDTYNRLRGYR